MVISDDFMNASVSSATSNGASEIALFDENHLTKLSHKQKRREDEVRDLLNRRSPSKYSPGKSNSTKLLSSKDAKIRYLQNQIEEVRQEINRIKMEGESQIKEYNQTLKQEQDDFEIEVKKFREEGATIDAKYVKLIEELEKRFESCRKPLTEVPPQISQDSNKSNATVEEIASSSDTEHQV